MEKKYLEVRKNNFFMRCINFIKQKLDLQAEYEKGNVELFMLSDEEIHELNLLYKRQVEELAKELEDKRTQLRRIKAKTTVNFSPLLPKKFNSLILLFNSKLFFISSPITLTL